MELFQLEGICFHSAGVFHLGKSAARMLGGVGKGGKGGGRGSGNCHNLTFDTHTQSAHHNLNALHRLQVQTNISVLSHSLAFL